MAYFPTNVLDNQIKALPTIASASGSIANFTTDKAENLVECVCEVASGASEVNVVACGKNLASIDLFSNTSYFTINADGTVTQIANDNRSENSMPTISLKAGTYTISRGVAYQNMAVYYYNNGWVYLVPSTSAENATFTLTNDIDEIYIKWSFGAGSGYPRTLSPQIEVGSRKTEFEPYNGNIYNIQLGETLTDTAIYNAVTGVLTRGDATTKQLDSCPIVTIANSENNIWADTGDIIDLKFVLSVGKAIS